MRILVTGGAGFIGSNLVDTLMGAGHVPGVIDDLSAGKLENLSPAVWFRRLDILDVSLETVVAEFAPDAIVHLAAQASVQVSLRDPERDWAVNAEGTRAVARAARLAGTRRVISASSAAVYGDPASVPVTEGAPTNPLSPYGRSKLASEGLLAEELAGAGVDHASFRFSNVYGPRQDAQGEGGVISIFFDTIAAGGEPVIFGDGEQTRDFIYVADVAQAIRTALEAESPLAQGGRPAAYNISTGVETPLRVLAETVRTVSGYSGRFGHELAREGDIGRSALDATKALASFGWRAAESLERGLATTWRWFSAQASANESAAGGPAGGEPAGGGPAGSGRIDAEPASAGEAG